MFVPSVVPFETLISTPINTFQELHYNALTPALEGRHRVQHVQVLSYFSIAYKYDITHRLSQHLTALSRNSMEQGERDDGDRGPRGNRAEDDVKCSVGHGYYCITSYICNKHELSS